MTKNGKKVVPESRVSEPPDRYQEFNFLALHLQYLRERYLVVDQAFVEYEPDYPSTAKRVQVELGDRDVLASSSSLGLEGKRQAMAEGDEKPGETSPPAIVASVARQPQDENTEFVFTNYSTCICL